MENEPILRVIVRIKALKLDSEDEHEQEEFESHKKRAMDSLFTLYKDYQKSGKED
ncbi:hypothetical protein [Mammaliicoccus lentus]|uniref:hypothetical protein n=1 Tax=Mammaliicoccus lentus TaxID=42858 RepID=UPI001430864E|nr:hypothetical protein [Mammaliicoccus lentus]MBF0793322.1 hypothetical protein [Mammaliicoccus lentus]